MTATPLQGVDHAWETTASIARVPVRYVLIGLGKQWRLTAQHANTRAELAEVIHPELDVVLSRCPIDVAVAFRNAAAPIHPSQANPEGPTP